MIKALIMMADYGHDPTGTLFRFLPSVRQTYI